MQLPCAPSDTQIVKKRSKCRCLLLHWMHGYMCCADVLHGHAKRGRELLCECALFSAPLALSITQVRCHQIRQC